MFKPKAKPEGTRRHLAEKELNGLWYVLTRLYLLRPRYASAFLSAFSQDLAEQMPKVVHAAIRVPDYVAIRPYRAINQETEHTLELTCAIVAVVNTAKCRLMRKPFLIDTQKAIWCLIFVGAKVVEGVCGRCA